MIWWFYSDVSLDITEPVVLGLNFKINHWLPQEGEALQSATSSSLAHYLLSPIVFYSPPPCLLCQLLKSSVKKIKIYFHNEINFLYLIGIPNPEVFVFLATFLIYRIIKLKAIFLFSFFCSVTVSQIYYFWNNIKFTENVQIQFKDLFYPNHLRVIFLYDILSHPNTLVCILYIQGHSLT